MFSCSAENLKELYSSWPLPSTWAIDTESIKQGFFLTRKMKGSASWHGAAQRYGEKLDLVTKILLTSQVQVVAKCKSPGVSPKVGYSVPLTFLLLLFLSCTKVYWDFALVQQ